MSSPVHFPENKDLGEPGNFSKASESKITTPEEDKKKEEKAKVLIDQIVSERLQPIEAQLAELPGLIQNTVVDVIRQLQNQQQEQPQQAAAVQPQQSGTDTEKLKALGEIAQGLAPFFGKNEAPNQNNELQGMIMNSFAKMIQAKVDETIMSTYQTPVTPPSWVTSRNPQVEPKRRIEVE